MSRLPRGLVAALSASIAVHVALVAGRWPGAASPGMPHAPPPVFTARLIGPTDSMIAMPTVPATALPPDTQAAATLAPAELSRPAPVSPQAPAATPPEAVPEAQPPATPLAPANARLPGPNPQSALVLPGVGADSSVLGLDRGPQPLDDIEAAFPAATAARGGTVTVRLAISERGLVERVTLLRSSAPGLVDEAMLAAALARVRFAPGLRGGAPARAEVVYEIDFAAIGKGTDASGKTY